MKCDLWFPTPIWSTTLTIDNDSIHNWCEKIQLQDPGRTMSNQDAWQSNTISVEDHIEIAPLMQELFSNTAAVIDDYKFKITNKSIKCLNLWVNVNNSKSSYNRMHIHPQSTISGVYYVKCNERSGGLCFPRDSREVYILETTGKFSEQNKFNCCQAKYSPEPGKLLLFPSYLPHYVENNQDDEERISIAFNMAFF